MSTDMSAGGLAQFNETKSCATVAGRCGSEPGVANRTSGNAGNFLINIRREPSAPLPERLCHAM